MNSEKEEKGWMNMQKSILVQSSNSGANFIYNERKVWCYRLVSKIVTGNVGMMGMTNQKKGRWVAAHIIRSRCDTYFGQRLYKPIGGAALRLTSLCAGLNRDMAREVRVV